MASTIDMRKSGAASASEKKKRRRHVAIARRVDELASASAPATPVLGERRAVPAEEWEGFHRAISRHSQVLENKSRHRAHGRLEQRARPEQVARLQRRRGVPLDRHAAAHEAPLTRVI